ncbi:hypothetical protein [Butyrivibrio sp. INlla16]|uniref:hypothetical protein n=1 Tax=Butyrivibrio sp. INlla16 TaxID=1520807 RepID=UPI00088C7BED|nr:hypothetical protein [Butyrivibrio sp. INlla16]SDB34325.1 hypothetical protein SAMN02910263_01650 [Butyrivibrio sp. INlla16]
MNKRKKRIANAPEGSLRIATTGGKSHYYLGIKGHRKSEYIRREDSDLVSELAQKRYDLKFVSEAEKEQKRIHSFLRGYSDNIPGIISGYPSELKQKLDFADMPDDDYARDWQQFEFVPKKFDEEMPYHVTVRGERVRSKSEEMIANALFSREIPYRYECPIILNNGQVRYPDFTILKPETREEIFLEHLGMLDNPEYLEKNMKKFREYENNGIILGRNLLVTYESSKQPLNSRIVENFIEAHFGKISVL